MPSLGRNNQENIWNSKKIIVRYVNHNLYFYDNYFWIYDVISSGSHPKEKLLEPRYVKRNIFIIINSHTNINDVMLAINFHQKMVLMDR